MLKLGARSHLYACAGAEERVSWWAISTSMPFEQVNGTCGRSYGLEVERMGYTVNEGCDACWH